MKSTSRIVLAVIAALAAAATGARAQDAASRGLDVRAENVTARELGRTVSAEAVPGDVVRYELRFTNPTAAPVRNVVFDNPVPTGMRYEAGSARASSADAVITYSIDGGRTYSAQPMIEKVVDGQRRTVAASADMFTHVRWTVGSTLRPRAQVTAEFRVRVNGRTAEVQ